MATTSATLKQLRAFLAIAEQRSFTHAAARLFVTQSTLTSTLQQLEDGLGLRLLDRSTRQVSLTPHGADFLPVVRRLLGDLDSSLEDIRAVASRKRGVVRIAAGIAIVPTVLPKLVAEFSRLYPGIEVHVREDTGDGVARRVRAGEVDMAISGKFAEHDPRLEFKTLLHTPFGVVCRNDHPLAADKVPIGWKDLAEHVYIAFSRDNSVRRLVERTPAAKAFADRAGFEASSLLSMYGFLREGAGFTILSSLAACYDPDRVLCFRPLIRPSIERELCMITPAGRMLSPAAKAMEEHCCGRLADVVEQTLGTLGAAKTTKKRAPPGRP